MPLLNGRPIKFLPHPSDLTPTTKVFQIRFTGEIFTEYTSYSSRLDFYRQPKFACAYTGKSGFNYENALSNENETKKNIYNQIPSEYIPIILENTQFSQLKLTELVNLIANKLIQITEINKQKQKEIANNTNQTPTSENTNNKNNSNNSNNKKQPSKLKCPIKKTLIRTLIRITSKQYNFKLSPWILHNDIANKYNITTKMPKNLEQLITEYLNKKNAPKKTKKMKIKKSKSLSVKPETLISKLCISTNKQLKYPCDDQLLLMYDKYENHKIIAYDQLWNKIHKIGINNDVGDDIEDDDYSNLAFIDYNMLYDNGDGDGGDDMNMIKHKQLNNIFSEIWTIWSFISIYFGDINISPFPLSYLIDSLSYDKRCILFDEIQICLLEIIRRHIIQTIENKINFERDNKIKKKLARKKAKKANKRAAKKKKLRRLQKEKEEKEKKMNDKMEMDQSDDENNNNNNNNKTENDENEMDESEESESEEEEEESESESDEESDSYSESDSSMSDTSEITESEYEICVMDIINNNSQKYNSLIFNIEPIQHFRLDLLRDYLEFRCNIKNNDDDIDDNSDVSDIDNNMDIDMKSEMSEKTNDSIDIKEEPILPKYEYVLDDYIWDKLNNIRNYISLGIEGKLEIIKILFRDVMSTCIMTDIIRERINKYQTIKIDIKTLDDEYTNIIKTEKNKLKNIRNQLIEKKRILYPKKQKSKNTSKNNSKITSKNASKNPSKITSKNTSKNATKSPSNSPNKENNSTKSNSIDNTKSKPTLSLPRVTSRQQSLLLQKQEREKQVQLMADEKKKELLRKEIEKLEFLLRNNKQLMDAKCKTKELEIQYKKYKLSQEYNTHLIELGSDRFYNKYYWNLYSDGRIFILHSNIIYHKNNNNNSIIQQMIKLKNDNIKCYNQWELINDNDNNNNNNYCWSYISTSTELNELLNVLDVRGVRENELYIMLNALKNDIIMSMKMVGNDDYKINENGSEEMSVDGVGDNDEPKQLRRSKRATKGVNNNNNNNGNKLHGFIQMGNKGFLSYKNKMKRK